MRVVKECKIRRKCTKKYIHIVETARSMVRQTIVCGDGHDMGVTPWIFVLSYQLSPGSSASSGFACKVGLCPELGDPRFAVYAGYEMGPLHSKLARARGNRGCWVIEITGPEDFP